MKVIYLGPTEPNTLDYGGVYEVLSEEDGWYRIIDKSGEDYLYPKDEFKILEDSHKIWGVSVLYNLEGERKIENLTIKTGSTLTEYAEKLQKQEK